MEHHKKSHNGTIHPHQEIEKVIRVVKQSRRAILGNYLVVLFFGYFTYYSFYLNTELYQFGGFFLLFTIIVFLYSEFKIHYRKLIITNKRALVNEGILKKHHITIRYSSITEIISTQNLFQRLLNYGNLIIQTSGIKREQDLKMNHISNPSAAKNVLEHFMIGGQ